MKNIISLTFVSDFSFIAVLVALSFFLVSFYFKSPYINTGYPDWSVHAFRIKSLQQFGLISWTHAWSNGISLWRSYQFIPHYLTLDIVKLFSTSITRAMVLMTIGLFVVLRLLIYFSLRLLHFSPITAFASAILSLDIAQYWGGVSDYSLMFGFVFFPIVILLWVKSCQGKLQYLFPYLVGVSFYVHPILGYTSMALWGVGVIFSSKKIFSLSVFVQFFIILATSSIFWFPLVHKTSYEYTSPVFANKYFLNLTISGYQYFGLSLFILICLFSSFLLIFIPLKQQFKWAKILSVFSGLFFLLVVIGLTFDLPQFISQFQFTRGVTFIGIGAVFAFAPLIEKMRRINSNVIKGALLFLICLVLTEGMWFTSIYSPIPSKEPTEQISRYIKQNPKKDLSDARIWTSSIGTSGYYAPLSYRYPYSYMGHLESNQVATRISPLILYTPYPDEIPYANLVRLNDYFKITGTKYLFFDQGSVFTKSISVLPEQLYKDDGEFKSNDADYHLFEVPWQTENAILINKTYENAMKPFPFNLKLSEVNDQIALDEYVKKFLGVLYQPSNQSLAIAYPTQESLAVAVPAGRSSNLIYINESFDSGWKAYFNNHQIRLQAVGPNFILARLENTNRSGVLFLKHSWPLSFYISLYLIILIPIEIILANLLRPKPAAISAEY